MTSHVEERNLEIAPDTVGDLAEQIRSARPSLRKLLVLSSSFPSVASPGFGLFVKERVRAIAALPGYDIRVVAPVPYFPPIRAFKRWYNWSQFPRYEIVDGLRVYRPRYPLIPKLGGYLHPTLMFPTVYRTVRKLRREFDFNLIDAHFSYPNGVVATRLGERFQRPVMITGRGEDMCRFPDYPVIGPQIRRGIAGAAHCIGVSREIADAFIANGASADQVSVISNGVDCTKFLPLPRDEARGRLGLATDAKIIISVGDRFENKGFHILVDAIAELRKKHPTVMGVIIGGPPKYGTDYTAVIEERVAKHGLQDRILLPGFVPHEELACWYSAADVFALLSAREGSPNVLVEALACGIPAVATAVGGVPDVLNEPALGSLVEERTSHAVAAKLDSALSTTWNRETIRAFMENRSWHETANAVRDIVENILETPEGKSR